MLQTTIKEVQTEAVRRQLPQVGYALEFTEKGRIVARVASTSRQALIDACRDGHCPVNEQTGEVSVYSVAQAQAIAEYAGSLTPRVRVEYQQATRSYRRLRIRNSPTSAQATAKGVSKTGSLTKRQLEVAQLLADGLSNEEIGVRLSLSPRTVDCHIEAIRITLQAADKLQAVVKALRMGWIK